MVPLKTGMLECFRDIERLETLECFRDERYMAYEVEGGVEEILLSVG